MDVIYQANGSVWTFSAYGNNGLNKYSMYSAYNIYYSFKLFTNTVSLLEIQLFHHRNKRHVKCICKSKS